MKRISFIFILIATSCFAQKTISDTLKRPSGAFASGTAIIDWPAFTTADSHAVAAGSQVVTIGAAGAFTVSLYANQSSSPAGVYYKVVWLLSDGSESTEYWVVPGSSGPFTIAMVRSATIPSMIQPTGGCVGDGCGGGTLVGAILSGPSTGSGSPLAQYVQPTVSNIAGLGVLCGASAAGTQPCFVVGSSAGSSLLQVLNNGTVVFSSGSGGLIQIGGVQVAETTVSFASSETFDLLSGDVFLTTLTGNVTSSSLSNTPQAGFARRVTFIICQDGTGGRTFAWPTVMRGAMIIGSVANLCSTQTFLVDSSVARATDAGVVNE